MGTTLTGTTPQDTYDSLIKVTDNGPISGTAKFLSDGLGNDSVLALSTTLVGIGRVPTAGFVLDIETGLGTYPRITGSDQANVRLRFANGGAGGRNYELIGGLAGANNSNFSIFDATAAATRLTIDSTGNVGIGTNAPETKLNLVGGNIRLNTGSGTVGTSSSVEFSASANNSVVSAEVRSTRTSGGGADLKFFTTISVGAAPTEKLSILEGGGLTFNGDTAEANALDDYEEGTWTMGISFGGASVGMTLLSNTGTYTKIGRQVTVNGIVVLSSKGSSSGDALLTGLPFTIPNAIAHLPPATLWLSNVTFLDQHQAVGKVNTTSVEFWEITTSGATSFLNNTNFANNSEIIINMTYFV